VTGGEVGRGLGLVRFLRCCRRVPVPISYCICQSPIRQPLSHPRIISVIAPLQVVLCFFLVGYPVFPPACRSSPFGLSGFILRISTLGYLEGLCVGW